MFEQKENDIYMDKSALGRKRKRDLAEHLYLTTEMSQKEICELVGWRENTFSSNKIKYGWDKRKGAQEASVQTIISNIYTKLAEMSKTDAVKHAKDMAMLSNVLERIRGKQLTPTNYIEAFKELSLFLMKQDVELAQKLNAYMKSFVELKIKEGL